MKKNFVEPEIQIISISALEDLMNMASARGDIGDTNWDGDPAIVPDSGWGKN